MSHTGESSNPYPVNPTGYLIGAFFAMGLYGIHIAQVHRYAFTPMLVTPNSTPMPSQLLVAEKPQAKPKAQQRRESHGLGITSAAKRHFPRWALMSNMISDDTPGSASRVGEPGPSTLSARRARPTDSLDGSAAPLSPSAPRVALPEGCNSQPQMVNLDAVEAGILRNPQPGQVPPRRPSAMTRRGSTWTQMSMRRRRGRRWTSVLVGWVWLLSTLQILIIMGSAWKYYVWGIAHPSIWGEFYWPLSFQDGLIPTMAFTAQLYFGHRAWLLTGRKRWIRIASFVLPSITLCAGFALAITARIWANDPWVSAFDMAHRAIGIPSQVVAITWMGLTAATDLSITLVLVYRFWQARRSPHSSGSSSLYAAFSKFIALTLETVLLTHLCGAVMCVLFLSAPASARTRDAFFWVLLEVVTELYALSILFTINTYATVRMEYNNPHPNGTISMDEMEPPSASKQGGAVPPPSDLAGSALDRWVEGHRGETPYLPHGAKLPWDGDSFAMAQGNGMTFSRDWENGGEFVVSINREQRSRDRPPREITPDTSEELFTPMTDAVVPTFAYESGRRGTSSTDMEDKDEKEVLDL